MTISMVALPATTAQSTEKSYPFINAVPNPAGVNQQVYLHVGIKHPLANTNEGWHDLSVTITGPVSETIDDITTDSTGATGVIYVPTMAGNYTLVTHFPQQTLPTATARPYVSPAGTVMLAADSDPLTLVVTEEPVQYYPGAPLPTEYWTRPIDSQLREWSAIAGNWLDATRRNPQFVTGNDYAPETAHILWTKEQATSGGLVGKMTQPIGSAETSSARDQFGNEPGDAYEGKWDNTLIMQGKLYYNKYAGVEAYKEIVCVDLHTGEEIWSRVLLNNLTMSRGQLMSWVTYDNQGVWDYIWATGNAASLMMIGYNYTAALNVTASQLGTIWMAFNPVNGDFIYALYNVPSGTAVNGPNGEILIYNVDLARGYMTMWNSTNIPSLYASTQYPSMGWGQWKAPQGRIVNATGLANVVDTSVPPKPINVTYNGLNGYQWNVSIAGVTPGVRAFYGSVRAIYPDNKIVGSTYSATSVTHWGINLNTSKGNIGQQLFNTTESAPAAWNTGNLTIAYQTTSEDVFVYWASQTTKYYAWSATDGKFLWETPISEMYQNFYGWTELGERPVIIGYGKMISTGVSGVVYCYDLKDGSVSWIYHAVNPYPSELPINNDWWQFPLFITDGKYYSGHTQHSVNQPQPRGAPFLCLNVTTGEVIWRANGLFRQSLWGGEAIIGDSIIATQDTYDQRIYAIGKGPSATTVSAGPKVSVEGSSVLVEGMVTDISPGTQQYSKTARFPNGVPAVADENQSDWMLYVYKQFARPADVVGVEVVLSVLDPNNNCYEVGRATSDATGFYSLAFTPQVPGKYTIYATFDGSKAYYGSAAETAINVDSAPAATPPPTPSPAPMTDTYIMGSTVGIIIAIIVVGLLLFLLLRKR
jgi:hypothetical protein